MSDLKLKSASVILLEENGEIRRLVKSTLQGIGFGVVHECARADKVRSVAATPAGLEGGADPRREGVALGD